MQHNDVFKLHDVDGDQVLTSLGLRVRVISCDKEQSCVHDSSASKHRCHQGIVAGAINKRDVSHKDKVRRAAIIGAHDLVRVRRAKRLEAIGSRASWTLEKLCVGITKFDCNVTEFFTEMAHSLSKSQKD